MRGSWEVLVVAFLLFFSGAALAESGSEETFDRQRRELVSEVRRQVRMTAGELGRADLSPAVLAALEAVPRHRFVPEQLRDYAYDNRPLPIGYGQTISQPYIVAIMTDLLGVGEGDVVLEVGTGSAYQAAVLAELVDKVYTIEIIPDLGAEAAERLAELGYENVLARVGDGYYGWEAAAPFDGILVTAAASHVPPPLIKQLRPGARMLIPVGGPFSIQHLMLLEKTEKGKIRSRQVLPVAFVPLTGEH